MNYAEHNLTLAQQMIELQQEKRQPQRIFEEIGANSEIAHTLQQCSGSSTLIHKSLCSYHKETQAWNPKDQALQQQRRSVSPEFINAGLDHYKRTHPRQSLYINSFQTESDPTKVTHGWIGIDHNDSRTLYHVTIPEHLHRPIFQKVVGNIGLQLITQCLEPKHKLNTPYIDHVYDADQQNVQKTIDLMQKDSVVCINQAGQLCRVEDLTRTRDGYQPLIIYKGSFDPPHNGHLYMIETVQKKYPNHTALFSISVNNYDKGDVSSDEIMQRIDMINTLGYPVILFGSAYFKDNMDRLRLKNTKEIIFPVGSDTVERIFKTYDDKDQMIHDFNGVRFESFGREQFQFDSKHYQELFSQNDENPFNTVSSSMIKTNITEYKKNIPDIIQHFCEKKYL